MRRKKPEPPTPIEMRKQIRELGQLLGKPGDKDPRRIELCADAIGLTFRKARSYWHGEIAKPDRAHFNEIQRLLAGERTPQDEFQELRDRIARLERLLVQTDPAQVRTVVDEDLKPFDQFRRLHSSMA